MIPVHLERAVFGIYATHSLHFADRSGVFVHLADHGSATAAELSGALGVDGETLERLLLVLVSLQVLTRTEGRYALAEGTRPYLDSREPHYLLGFVDHLVGSTAQRFGQVHDYLSRGKAAVDAELPDPFATLYRDDDSVRRFLTAMWQLSFHVSHELARLADLGDVRRLVDVGGASGPFSVAALLAYPRLRSTVFDLPQVGPYLAERAEAYELGDRLTFAGGDFFRDPLPEGDCVAFGYILSDWDDDTCEGLLRKAYDACRPGGRVLVMERLFDPDRRGPLSTAVMNLSMHLETQGRHRTPEEYLGLLRRAGFADCAVRRSTADKHLLVGRRSPVTVGAR
ncbi:hydroxyneurosporene methyltransferase [Microbispora sp. NEAU-D428]|uniref:methyltransferase n=1 Tax=Microbispora sitophila TaxID=2771537 RepID=UPI0018667549|nr:methyltransferase [Microbispora sitophila]MBE3015904.1 hydroxyneurosporene methyltransferase [Microbispora sitophila]